MTSLPFPSLDRRAPGAAPGAAPLPGTDAPADQASALRRLLGVAPDAPPPAPIPISSPVASPIVLPRTLAVASGKGGVGKTTLSVNLCVALARLGVRATLVDGDLGLANADVLCGVNTRAHLADALDTRRDLADIAIDLPWGFRLVPGAGGVASMADLPPERLLRLVASLRAVAEGSACTLIDCGAGIGRGVMTLVNASAATWIVTTPEPTAIADAYAVLKCALAARAPDDPRPRPALVVAAATSEADARATHARIDAVARRFLGAPLDLVGWTLMDPEVSASIRRRRPICADRPSSPAARAITLLADSVRKQFGIAPEAPPPAPHSRGWLARFVRPGRPLQG